MITRQFEARVRRTQQTDVNVPVQVVLSYDAGTDPYAVKATFLGVQVTQTETEDRVWDFARELLSKGAHSLVQLGHGDVRFRLFHDMNWPLGEGSVVMMCMRNRDGHADVTFPHSEVLGFLDDTQALFDEATSDCTPAVDLFLKEVLG